MADPKYYSGSLSILQMDLQDGAISSVIPVDQLPWIESHSEESIWGPPKPTFGHMSGKLKIFGKLS